MNEALLYHLWKYRLFKSLPLTTIDGKTIEVIKNSPKKIGKKVIAS